MGSLISHSTIPIPTGCAHLEYLNFHKVDALEPFSESQYALVDAPARELAGPKAGIARISRLVQWASRERTRGTKKRRRWTIMEKIMRNTTMMPIKELRILWHPQRKGGLSAVVGMSASKRWVKPRRCPLSKRGEAVSTLGIDLSTHVGK